MVHRENSPIAALLGLCALMAACSDPPGGGSSNAVSYDGQWSGSTSQGTTISFVVASQRLSGLSVGYNLNGCSGTRTGDKSVEITSNRTSTGETNALVVYVSGSQFDANFISLDGKFTSATTAEGTVFYHACTAGGVAASSDALSWTATKR